MESPLAMEHLMEENAIHNDNIVDDKNNHFSNMGNGQMISEEKKDEEPLDVIVPSLDEDKEVTQPSPRGVMDELVKKPCQKLLKAESPPPAGTVLVTEETVLITEESAPVIKETVLDETAPILDEEPTAAEAPTIEDEQVEPLSSRDKTAASGSPKEPQEVDTDKDIAEFDPSQLAVAETPTDEASVAEAPTAEDEQVEPISSREPSDDVTAMEAPANADVACDEMEAVEDVAETPISETESFMADKGANIDCADQLDETPEKVQDEDIACADQPTAEAVSNMESPMQDKDCVDEMPAADENQQQPNEDSKVAESVEQEKEMKESNSNGEDGLVEAETTNAESMERQDEPEEMHVEENGVDTKMEEENLDKAADVQDKLEEMMSQDATKAKEISKDKQQTSKSLETDCHSKIVALEPDQPLLEDTEVTASEDEEGDVLVENDFDKAISNDVLPEKIAPETKANRGISQINRAFEPSVCNVAPRTVRKNTHSRRDTMLLGFLWLLTALFVVAPYFFKAVDVENKLDRVVLEPQIEPVDHTDTDERPFKKNGMKHAIHGPWAHV